MMVKFTWFNTYYSRKETYLGKCGCAGDTAETFQEAVNKTLDDASRTRKLWGFPIVVKTKITFEHEP